MENEKSFKTDDIKKVLDELMAKMGFEATFEAKSAKMGGEEVLIFNFFTDESNLLIGQHGVNLQSLQHLARLLVRKKLDSKINFVIDVNSYRQEKTNSVSKMARSMAEQAVSEKRPVVLRPMSPYERRIVHMELAEFEGVKTESIGDGEDRRVVIKPAGII